MRIILKHILKKYGFQNVDFFMLSVIVTRLLWTRWWTLGLRIIRFSQRCNWGFVSSKIRRCVIGQSFVEVSKERSAFKRLQASAASQISGSIKGGDILHRLGNYQLLRKAVNWRSVYTWNRTRRHSVKIGRSGDRLPVGARGDSYL